MTIVNPAAPDTLLSWATVKKLVGVSRTTIWRMRHQGLFPPPRVVGGRHVWLSSEIAAWQAALPVAVI